MRSSKWLYVGPWYRSLVFSVCGWPILFSFRTQLGHCWNGEWLLFPGKRCSSQLSSPASQLPTTWRRRRYRREMTWALIIRARTILAALHQNRGCDTWLRLLRLLKTFCCFTRTSFFKLTKLKLKSLYMLNKRCSVLKPNLGSKLKPTYVVMISSVTWHISYMVYAGLNLFNVTLIDFRLYSGDFMLYVQLIKKVECVRKWSKLARITDASSCTLLNS